MLEYCVLQLVECGYPRRLQWCLARPTGTEYAHAVEVLNRLKAEHPEIEYKIEEVEPQDQWWHRA